MSQNPNKEILRLYKISGNPTGRKEVAFIYHPTYNVQTDGITWVTIADTTPVFPPGKTESDFIIKGITTAEALTPGDLNNALTSGKLYFVEYDTYTASPYYMNGNEKILIITPDQEKKTTYTPVFTFRVNPTHIEVKKSKLFTKLRTRGGFEFQHWGPDITEISLEGTTGNLMPNWVGTRFTNIGGIKIPIPTDWKRPDISMGAPTIENSDAMKAFRELDSWLNNDQDESMIKAKSRLALSYRGQIFVGHIANFSYEERGDQPFQIYYNMQFLVHYEASAIDSAEHFVQENVQRNTETIDRLKQIKQESTEASDSSDLFTSGYPQGN
jgi:hypothetical protein